MNSINELINTFGQFWITDIPKVSLFNSPLKTKKQKILTFIDEHSLFSIHSSDEFPQCMFKKKVTLIYESMHLSLMVILLYAILTVIQKKESHEICMMFK